LTRLRYASSADLVAHLQPVPVNCVQGDGTAPGGELSYQRGHIKVSHQVAQAISEGLAVIVIHGVDHDGTPGYSGPPSDLAPSLPTEATDPALCGVISN
jgi:hypothetical protein